MGSTHRTGHTNGRENSLRDFIGHSEVGVLFDEFVACAIVQHLRDKEKKMVHAKHLWGAVLALSAALASVASADSVLVTQNGVSDYRIFDASVDGGKSYHSTLAGILHWKHASDNSALPPEAFDTFCIELTQKVGYGKYTYNVSDLDDALGLGSTLAEEKADLISELWGRHHRDVAGSDTSAAFQLAIWEILYDARDGAGIAHHGLDLKGGSFRVKDPIANKPFLATAQNWLWELDGTGPEAHLMGMTNTRYQDQVFEARLLPAVPLPAAAWSGMIMLAGMVALKARHARAKA